MLYPYKPTLILVNSFTTTTLDLYRRWPEKKKLTSAMDLVVIELFDHGQTQTKSKNFTYWDTAIMDLQVMEVLAVEKAFVRGTSEVGWITLRMALLATPLTMNPNGPTPSAAVTFLPSSLATSMLGRLKRVHQTLNPMSIPAISSSTSASEITATRASFTVRSRNHEAESRKR